MFCGRSFSFIFVLLLISSKNVLGNEPNEGADEEHDDSETCEAHYGEDGLVSCKSDAKVTWNSNADGTPPKASEQCLDRRDDCPEYVEGGHCESSPGWMIMNCPFSCKSCHLRDPAMRCNRSSLAMDQNPTYQPGDMNKMFESIVERFGSMYDVKVLSTDPWVVTFENFLHDDEIKTLIASAKVWEHSTDTGSTNEFGETGRILSTGRTSSNAWCQHECMEMPHVQQVFRRIENVTNVPHDNYESFQILRYELGQLYKAHHDSDQEDVALACGPRILTFFLYLSDVEEGGETTFPLLNLTVQPKKGKALLWPSTYDHDPSLIDPRTMHEARPVIKGRKYAANSWIHLYDYTVPNLWGCTGVFD